VLVLREFDGCFVVLFLVKLGRNFVEFIKFKVDLEGFLLILS
jgi:hypothetical protein